MKKSNLQRKVERLIKKCEKMNYEYSSIDLSAFEALGRMDWDEDKVNFIALRHFESLYKKFYG